MVIPCFKVTRHVMGVLAGIGPEVDRIYCVDDGCPDGSGEFIASLTRDPRVRVIHNIVNQGVGGATLTGYRHAIADGAEVVVKLDGDGQMDPRLITALVVPVLQGQADYAKGNRFYNLEHIRRMPKVRIFGNAMLSMFSKLSTGYWDLFDPTNGYTAVHADIIRLMPVDKISKRYFFESDFLFRLSTFRAVVIDVPMDAKYEDEVSGLKAGAVVGEFSRKHAVNFMKRITYNYLLRNMSLASLQLLVGAGLLLFGTVYGMWRWWISIDTGVQATAGTVMVPTMCILMGLQLVLAFLAYDIASVPRRPIHPTLRLSGSMSPQEDRKR